MRWLYPIRTGVTLVDYWTLAHLAFWYFIGTVLAPLGMPLPKAIGLSLIGAICWELFERIAEARWPELWQSPESWLNAYVSDPLTAVVAICVAYHGFHHWRP